MSLELYRRQPCRLHRRSDLREPLVRVSRVEFYEPVQISVRAFRV
jgi:hypothetical protein